MSIPTQQRIWTLAAQPTGVPDANTFKLSTVALPKLAADQVLVRVEYLSNDPVVRHRLDALPVGSPIGSWGVCTVLDSTSAKYKVGDSVFSQVGWCDCGILDAATITSHAASSVPGKPYASISPLGLSALTAYQGIVDVLKVTSKDIVLIDGAGGSVGSAAVQMSKIAGARVVGIAGGPAKCKWVVDTLGADACVDYKAADFEAQLAAVLEPYGGRVTKFYDMIGGPSLDAGLGVMAEQGVIANIGAVSTYNNADAKQTFANMFNIALRKLTVVGSSVFDYLPQTEKAHAVILQWINEGKYKADADTVVDTPVDKIPETWVRLFQSGADHRGKLITHVVHQ